MTIPSRCDRHAPNAPQLGPRVRGLPFAAAAVAARASGWPGAWALAIVIAGLAVSPAEAQFAGCPVTGTWETTDGTNTYRTTLVEDGAGNVALAMMNLQSPATEPIQFGGSRSGATVTIVVNAGPGGPIQLVFTMPDCDTLDSGGAWRSVRLRSTYCGDGAVQSPDEQCDDGDFSSADGCSFFCRLPVCGNGVVEGGEQCDDGNSTNGDGCSTDCTRQICGNGVLEPGEGCDDGNTTNGDGCSTTCRPNVCGNGVIESGELCDDHNTVDGDGCSSLCQFEGCSVTGTWRTSVAGITVVSAEVEALDGSITGSAYQVGALATTAGTMNGTRTGPTLSFTWFGYASTATMTDCDHLTGTLSAPPYSVPFTSTRLRATYCGDGVVQSADEACDDGNFVNADGCTVACTPAGCGNGIVEAGEACDDGNLVNGDGCSAGCTVQVCRNGVVEPGEECDDGNAVDGDGCSARCQANVCGNGTREPGETCDDGNAVSGDGCSSLCQFEGCPLTGAWHTTALGSYDVTVVEGPDHADVVASPTGAPANALVGTVTRSGAQVSGSVGGYALQGTMLDCDSVVWTSPGMTWQRVRNTYCGDGVLQPAYELCDDGNLANGDGCNVACTANSGCGNAVVDAGEACDDGNASNSDGCTTTCQPNACGDGFVWLGHESCDDGNLVAGDGCDAGCKIEPESVSGSVGAFAKVFTTDDEGDGATPGDPVETTVTVPAGSTGGTVSITENAAPPSSPPGFAFMGTLVDIHLTGITPPPTAATPVVIAITLDASQLAPGQDAGTLQIHKDGVTVPDCTGLAGHADPDPCITSRETLADGDVRLTALTTTASAWTSIGNLCGSAPALGCRDASARGAKLKLVHAATKNLAVWAWKNAADVPSSAFGDPTTTSNQTLCVYDATGPVVAATAAAGGTCVAGRPCWKAKPTGFAFADKTAPYGLAKVALRGGVAGKGKVIAKAGGSSLDLGSLPLSGPVRVQLRSSEGACFQATFTTPTKSDGARYSATSD